MKLIEIDSAKKHIILNERDDYVVCIENKNCDLTVECACEGVKVKILGLYTGKDKENYILKTTQLHNAKNTYSDLLIKGVFDDESSFTYSGLIRINPSGNTSHAYQKNQNLLLSSKAKVTSEPNLEIYANDVFCTHGSTTGTLSKEQLFYIKSRGLNTSAAKSLLIQGFIQEVYDIKNQFTKYA